MARKLKIELLIGKINRNVTREAKKKGLSRTLIKIEQEGRRVSKKIPNNPQMRKINPSIRKYVRLMIELVDASKQASRWNNDQLIHFTREIGWVVQIIKTDVSYQRALLKIGFGTGIGGTCVNECEAEYDRCNVHNNCDTSGLTCVCCSFCSLQLSGCIFKCMF